MRRTLTTLLLTSITLVACHRPAFAAGDMVPGEGWTEPTAEVGKGPQAIAHFDEVPYRTFDGAETVSVVAVHKDGIAQVQIADAGGRWVTAKRTVHADGIPRWDATFRGDEGDAGPREIRAMVIPNAGKSRVLSLVLNARSGETWVTHDGDGDPGRVKYLRLTGKRTSMIGVRGEALWLDGVEFDGGGRTGDWSKKPFHHSWPAAYVTGGSTKNAGDGPVFAKLVRDYHVEGTGRDALSNVSCALNVTIHDVNGTGGSHPDIYQISGSPRENVLLWKITGTDCDCQGILADDVGHSNNLAFIDFSLHRSDAAVAASPVGPPFSQWIIATDHLVLRNVFLPTQRWVWRHPKMTNVLAEGFEPGEENFSAGDLWAHPTNIRKQRAPERKQDTPK